MTYPKWKYHVTEPAVIVQNEQDEADLGPEWVDEHESGQAVVDPASIEYDTLKIKKGPGRPKKSGDAFAYPEGVSMTGNTGEV